MNSSIFKAYDIRGKYPAELDEKSAAEIGNAIASYLLEKQNKKKLTLLLCRDVRISSLPLRSAVVRGVTDAGCHVIDAGVGTTPFFYFLLHTVVCDGGIMITASHNPPEYNGMKIRGRYGIPVAEGCGMEEIRDIVGKKNICMHAPKAKWKYSKICEATTQHSLQKKI